MVIESGLFDRMVLQRAPGNVSKAWFTGVCDGDGVVRVSVRQGRATVPGLERVVVGRVHDGRLEGCLENVPSGGPYTVLLEVVGAYVYRVNLECDRAVVKTSLPIDQAAEMFLYYGLGRRPYCNITDAADRALPAFGPFYLGGDTVYGPYINRLRVSGFMPSAGRLHDLRYPVDRDALALRTRQFDGTFCNLHPEIVASGMDDPLVYFAAGVRCVEPMETRIMLGYDGPVKMWVDGAEVLFDPDGVNPALVSDSSTTVRLGEGEHEVVVALGTNGLRAWGIFLRFARGGVAQGRIVQESHECLMPWSLE